jgi:enediyne biosynthesis protein E4
MKFRRLAKFIYVIVAAACFFSCSSKPDILFSRLESSATGILFNNQNTESENYNILTYEYYYNGGGVAVGDINNDGLTDIYFTSNSGENKLYLNQGDFQFKDITGTSGTSSPTGWKTGVSMVDANADGWLDIFVCRSGPIPNVNDRTNQLFINNKDLTFKESAWRVRLNDPSYTTQSAFFDYDRDGDLDVFVLNHSFLAISNSFDISQKSTSKRHPLVGNKLLRNDNGKYYDVSDSLGIYGPASNYGLGVSLSDINNDGWIDIYAGCDYTGRDRLLLNNKGKSFIDATDSLLSHLSKFTMGTDIADVNNDGYMDIYTVDMLPEDNYRQKQLQGSDRYDEYNAMVKNGLHHQCMRNMLHLNNGNGTFSEAGQMLGVSNTDWSWSSLFADFDNDGIQDLFVSNGFKRDLTNNDFAKFEAFNEIKEARKGGNKATLLDAIEKFGENKISNYIFQGRIDSAYRNVTEKWGLNEPSLTNGAAYADLDNDGDLDLITNNINDEAGIYRNNSEALAKNNFLRVQLSSSYKNSFAIGAKVSVQAGGDMQVRELLPVRGFQSAVDPILHFGLGKNESVDSVIVRWPDGTTQRLGRMKVNQLLKIAQTSGTQQAQAQSAPDPIFTETDQGPTFVHKENDFVDFRVQPLLPRMYSREGPAFAVGDINGDGISDYYFGGAAGQPGEIHLASKAGLYRKTNLRWLEKDKGAEDIDAVFFDADADGDADLYVVTGGYEITDSTLLYDKLYINNGNGDFTRGDIPTVALTGSCVKPADVDGDGDVDLFVGTRIIPGKYPSPPASILLLNDGKGNFLADPRFKISGMVTDAVWTDMNKDGLPDLVVVGEWMPVKVFVNNNGLLKDQSEKFLPQRTDGFWSCIVGHDFDDDGDMDFVVGNQGTNTQLKVSEGQPVSMVFSDFDGNGSIDPLMSHYVRNEPWPYPGRDELAEQLPSFKKRFTDYRSYSLAKMEQVLTSEELASAGKLNAYRMETSFMRNDNGKFVLEPMPHQLQMAPVFAMGLMDVNGDGYLDVITGGNMSAGRARTGKMTGNCGFVCTSDGKGGFTYVSPSESGIGIAGDIRKIRVVGEKIVFVLNSGKSTAYSLSRKNDP